MYQLPREPGIIFCPPIRLIARVESIEFCFCLSGAIEDDPEYVPEHIWVAPESPSDDDVDMTDEDDEEDDEDDEEETTGHGRIFIPLMGALMHIRAIISNIP